MRRIVRIIAAFAVLITLTACGTKLPDISEYGDTPITIAGLAEEEFTVTPNELAKLDLSDSAVRGKTEKAGRVSGIGPTLITFLEYYGRTADEFKYIRFTAKDEYRITLRGDKHTDDVVLMAIAGNDKPLAEAERPMRLIIPTAESNQWIYSVIRIEFITN